MTDIIVAEHFWGIRLFKMKLLKELEKDTRDKILGLLFVALALLLFISLLTYDFTEDHVNLQAALNGGSLTDVMGTLHNSGGLVGALIAYFLFSIFGFCAIAVPISLSAWGVNRFFAKPSTAQVRKWTLIIGGFMLALMTLISLPHGQDSLAGLGVTFGGIIGHAIASLLLTMFGAVFSYTLVISSIITGLMLVIPSAMSKWSNKAAIVARTIYSKIAIAIKSQKKIKTTVMTEKAVSVDSSSHEKKGLLRKLIFIKKKTPAVENIAADAAQPTIQEEEASSNTTDDISQMIKDKKVVNRIKPKITQQAIGLYHLPTVDLLDDPPDGGPAIDESYYRKTAEALRHTLLTFGVEIEGGEVNIFPGPIITRFEFKPASGIKVAQIVNLADDLALSMQAERIRIVAPIPGKPAVGVEIPNKVKRGIFVKEILSSKAFKESDSKLLIALGKTISGESYCADLAKMPHLLIAGSTGSGKSVCLNCIITSLIFRLHPDEIRFILIDPKRLELSIYDGLPHLEKPVVTEMKDAEKLLTDAVLEMENRYRKLARAGVRNITEYNHKEKEVLPYLVIIVDELADLMMTGSNRVESLITRLAQMARAVGIHLILATQRPSVDVITGLIKANFSSRIAFQTASKVDSRTILDANGAEKLLGRGDMLFSSPGFPEAMRIHGAYISGGETERLVDYISQQEYRTRPIETFEKSLSDTIPGFDPASDPLFNEAIELVIRHKQGSVSLLQRRLGVGYQRAARLIDQLEQAGVVGPYDGSKAREVLVDETYLSSREKRS